MRLTTSCNLRTDEFLWNYAIQTKDKMWNTSTDLHKSSNDKKQITLHQKLEMWANAQRDGRPAEHRWRPLFNAAKSG